MEATDELWRRTAYCSAHGIERIVAATLSQTGQRNVSEDDGFNVNIVFACGANGGIVSSKRNLAAIRGQER